MMYMISQYAQVIINQPSIHIDQYFDYKIPTALLGEIQEGQRVIVPFGRGDRTVDAFVVGIKDHCDIEDNKIKEIIQIIEEAPTLTANQLKLAKWIRDYYICLHIEALQVMIPGGMNIVKKERVFLNLARITEKCIGKNNTLESKVVQYIQEQNRPMDLDTIYRTFPGQENKRRIKKMVRENYLDVQEKFYMGIREKEEKYIMLSGKYKSQEDYLKEIKNTAHKQREIIMHLDHFPYKLRDIKNKLNISNSSIESLLKKELISITSKMVFRNPYHNRNFQNPRKTLTGEQKNIIEQFEYLIKKPSQKMLIHGVTGSGKTEIYLNMIEKMLKMGKQSILLVPEISLTPQMVERVIGRFGEQVSVLHSHLSHGEKYDQWKRIKAGKTNIVVGARSAIFAPLKSLGLIIIDEEHETSYKSSNRPRYHAKEVAEKLCEIVDSHLVLGSATPSIESYHSTENREYHLLSLKNRIDHIPMPDITLVDMRNELKEGNYSILSKELRRAIEQNLQEKHQSILFLNRRGYSTFVSCRKCGYVEKCPKCDVSLTYHQNNHRLLCHYCGYTKPTPKICPCCKSRKIRFFGTGTQKVETIIKKEFPQARILRMDVDTTRKKGSHDQIINAFKNQEADILIGTQMISKGLDFPRVTLVGVIIADTSLNLPDFRAAERTFQLTTQVAGRAGRSVLSGQVIVQTYEPSHYSLIHAQQHDYDNFYKEEINLRREMQYPPFKKLINIVFTGEDEESLIRKINTFYLQLTDYLREAGKGHLINDIFKPVPCSISKIKNKYRWHLIIKTNDLLLFSHILKKGYPKGVEESNNLNIAIDINPMSII